MLKIYQQNLENTVKKQGSTGLEGKGRSEAIRHKGGEPGELDVGAVSGDEQSDCDEGRARGEPEEAGDLEAGFLAL